MKLLHTSDWHLGKRLENISRMEEQMLVLEEICEIAENEQVDAILIAGDLFDTFNPPTEAIDIFYKNLKRLSHNGNRPVIAIAGNHDSPDRIETPDPLARECGIIFAGYPNTTVPKFKIDSGLEITLSTAGFFEIRIPGSQVPLRILSTPYANEYRIKTFLGHENNEEELRKVLQTSWQELANKYCDNKGVNVLLSHLFVIKNGLTPQEEPDDEKPILHVGGVQAVYSENIPQQIQYTALGHLHRMQRVDDKPCQIYYSGSPLSYSFAEASQQKYVLLVEVEPGKEAQVSKKELMQGKKLLRKSAEGMDEALKWLSENKECLVELTLKTDNFLSAQERKQLHTMHEGIISLIPEVKNADSLKINNERSIDLSKNMHSLFYDYFKYTKGQEPNDEIKELFAELLAED